MKRWIKALSAILVFVILMSGAWAEEETDRIKAEHETFVLEALQTLAKFGIDQSKMSKLAAYFEKESPSMQYLGLFDGGLYPRVRK